MALGTATRTFNLRDYLKGKHDPRSTQVYATTNVEDDRIVDTSTGEIYLGSGTVTITPAGDVSVTTPVPGTSNPSSWQTTVWINYRDKATGEHNVVELGPFTITSGGLLSELIEQQEVPPVYLTTVTAQMDTKVAAAEAAAASAEDAAAVAVAAAAPLTAPANNQVASYLELEGPAKTALGAAITGRTSPLAAWEAAVARRELAPARIVWLGSSTTFGNNSTNPSRRYVNLVTARLQAAFPSPIAAYEKPVVNVGNSYPTPDTKPGIQSYLSAAGGSNTENYVNDTSRPFIIWTSPHLVVHMIGSNDSLDVEPYAVPVGEYQTNITAAIDAIDAGVSHPVSHILVHTYRRNGVSAAKWATYRDALNNIAIGRDNVLVIDLSSEYERLDHDGANTLNLIDTDLIHQTDAGHAFMADLLIKAMQIPQSAGPDTRMVLLDTYTRPDGAAVGAEYPAGRSYVRVGSAVESIVGGKLTITTAGTILVESGLAELEIDALVTLPDPASAGLPGLVFRGADDANRMGLFLNGTASKVQLFKTQASATAALQEPAYSFPAGDYWISIRAQGDRIWGYVNGAKKIDYTMTAAEVTALGSLTRVGIRNNTVAAGVGWHYIRVRRL